jgi:uncharacterized protein involved in exopolysaccharide biosynthesis
MHEVDLSWQEAVAVVRRRRRLILQVFAGGLGLMTLGLMVLKPTYEATATLLVTATRAHDITADAEAMPTLDKVGDEDLNSYAELFTSETLIRQVLAPQATAGLIPEKGVVSRTLALPRDFFRSCYRFIHAIPAATPLDDWVDDVVDHLKVEIVKKTNLISVSYRQRGVDPEWTAAFVNALVDLGLHQSTNAGQQRQAREFFVGQRVVLSDHVRTAESAERDFFVRESLDAIPEQRSLLRTRLAELTQTAQDTERDHTVASARVAALHDEIRRHPEVIATEVKREQNQAVQFLKPRILEKEMERNQLLSLYAPTSDRVQDVERELAAAKRLLAAEVAMLATRTTATNPTYQTLDTDLAQAKVDAATLQARADALRAQIVEVRHAMAHLDDVAAERSRLDADLQGANDALATYTKKQEQARLGSALDQSRIVNLAIMEPAAVPPAPEHIHGMLLGVLGGLFFVCAAIGLAFLFDMLDPAIRGARDVEVSTGVPVLGEIPT